MRHNISDTDEFRFAPLDKQQWARRHPDANLSMADIMQRAGVDLQADPVMVLCNDGNVHPVEIRVDKHVVRPAEKYERRWESVGTPKKIELVTIIKGRNVNAKRSIYFTETQFNESADVNTVKELARKLYDDFMTAHIDQLKSELRKSYNSSIEAALKVLPPLIESKNTQKILDFFIDEGFNVGMIKPEEFDQFVRIGALYKCIPYSWTLTAKLDKYGHQTGTTCTIDWQNKVFKVIGWSSDD